MRGSIDVAGRVVIPKQLRDAAGLAPNTELEIRFRDGRIEIEPLSVPMRLRGGVIEAESELPPLTGEVVREVLERTRR